VIHNHSGYFFGSTSGATYQTTVIVDALCRTSNVFTMIRESIEELQIAFTRGPQYGWYSEFSPWPRIEHSARELLIANRPRRAQARACIKSARRWKRRRFVHSLRRRLVA
jgi:hypothetical protein